MKKTKKNLYVVPLIECISIENHSSVLQSSDFGGGHNGGRHETGPGEETDAYNDESYTNTGNGSNMWNN